MTLPPPTNALGREPTLLACLERGVLLALLAGLLATALLVVRNQMLPDQGPWTFALALLPWYVAFAALFMIPATAVAWAVGRAWKPGAAVLALRALPLVLAGLVAFDNTDWLLRGFTSLDGPSRHRYLLPAALVLGLLALGAMVALPIGRRWLPRLLTLGSLAAFTTASWPPPARPAPRPPAMPSPAGAPAGARPRLLLYGLDGADWRYVEPLMARGDLPNLAALRARGVSGSLASAVPTRSPVIWTTIATGQTHEVHGIEDFTVRQLRGVDDALPARLRRIRGLGFRQLEAWLEKEKWIYKAPVPSTARRVPAFWNIASRFGSPVSVVNWWATWPAEAELGAIVSERMFFWRFAAKNQWTPTERLVFPPELGKELADKVVRPEDVTYEEARRYMDITEPEFRDLMTRGFDNGIESEFKYLVAMHETNRRIAPAVMAWGRKTFGAIPDLLLLERMVDIACHDALRESELVTDHLKVGPERLARFSRVVTESYKSADRALGEYMAAFGDGNVVVVSDHGFALEVGEAAHLRSYNHAYGPDGIFVAAGPAFRQGKVEGLGILDLLPMLLYLKGLPVADDLPGRLPLEVFTPEFAASQKRTSIPSFGLRESTGAWTGPAEMDAEILERLRALGYVQ